MAKEVFKIAFVGVLSVYGLFWLKKNYGASVIQ